MEALFFVKINGCFDNFELIFSEHSALKVNGLIQQHSAESKQNNLEFSENSFNQVLNH